MHTTENNIDVVFAQKLLQSQFPHWANVSIELASSIGTDNIVFKLGDDACMRLPRTIQASEQIIKEQIWLPKLATLLPFEIPAVLGKGMPDALFDLPWSIYSWLDGKNAYEKPIVNKNQLAIDLSCFINSLQQIDIVDAPLSPRGMPLSTRDDVFRKSVISLKNDFDIEKITKIWDESLRLPAWSKSLVWLHSDLLPTNIVVKNDCLSGVIDFGMMGIGDPAVDTISAWSMLSQDSRKVFRAALDVDDATWLRGQGWAF